MTSKRDIQWIETGRTLAMIFILLVHAIEFAHPHGMPKATWQTLLSVFVRFTVPAFFVISGMLLQKSLKSSKADPNIGSFLYKKFTSLIIPFLVWNVIYMFVFHLLMKWPILSCSTAWKLSTGYMHLYFVFVLIQFFIFYPLAYPTLKKYSSAVVFGVGAAISVLFFIVSEILLWNYGPDGHFFEWNAGKLFVGWSIFFFWGTFLADHPEIFEKIKKNWIGLGVTTIIFFLLYLMETQFQMKNQGSISRDFFLISGLPFQFFGATLFLILMDWINRCAPHSRFLKIVNRSGKDTFGIYIAHVAVLAFFSYLVNQAGVQIPFFIQILMMVFTAWGVCQLTVRICRRPNFEFFNRLLFGGRD